MTIQEQLKKTITEKYHKSIIVIPRSIAIDLHAIMNETEILKDICSELNFTAKTPVNDYTSTHDGAHRVFILSNELVFKSLGFSTTPVRNTYSFEELCKDYETYLTAKKDADIEESKKNDDSINRAIEILTELNILKPFGDKFLVKRYQNSYTPAKAAASGYIQGSTTNEYSLWWHTNGQYILFVYSLGIFLIIKQ